MSTKSNYIPENTNTQIFTLTGENSYLVHTEVGPVFDSDLDKNIWLDVSIVFDYGKNPFIDILCLDIYKKSFTEKQFPECDKENTSSYWKKYEVEDFDKYACSDIFIAKYQDELGNILTITLNELREVVDINCPENKTLFETILQNKADWLSDSDFEDEEMVELPIDIDVDVLDDTTYALTAQVGPIYGDDNTEAIVFIQTLDYDTQNPSVYTFTKNLIVSDDPENMDEDFGNCEWIEVDDDDELYKKYESEFANLEWALLTRLFKIVEDKDALIELAQTLEADGIIVRCDDNEDEADYDFDDYEFNDDGVFYEDD